MDGHLNSPRTRFDVSDAFQPSRILTPSPEPATDVTLMSPTAAVDADVVRTPSRSFKGGFASPSKSNNSAQSPRSHANASAYKSELAEATHDIAPKSVLQSPQGSNVVQGLKQRLEALKLQRQRQEALLEQQQQDMRASLMTSIASISSLHASQRLEPTPQRAARGNWFDEDSILNQSGHLLSSASFQDVDTLFTPPGSPLLSHNLSNM
jgi:hypothetical protein